MVLSAMSALDTSWQAGTQHWPRNALVLTREWQPRAWVAKSVNSELPKQCLRTFVTGSEVSADCLLQSTTPHSTVCDVVHVRDPLAALSTNSACYHQATSITPPQVPNFLHSRNQWHEHKTRKSGVGLESAYFEFLHTSENKFPDFFHTWLFRMTYSGQMSRHCNSS